MSGWDVEVRAWRSEALLALVVGRGLTEPRARDVLEEGGGLYGLIEPEPTVLARQVGITPAAALRLQAAIELGRRTLAAPQERIGPLSCPAEALAVFRPRMAALPHEELHAAYIDRRNRMLAVRRLSSGSDRLTVVDPRQVFRPAVALGAAAVIVAHNHPSGDPEPSEQDIAVTRRLVVVGRALGLPLVDHLVVTDAAYTSMAALGLTASSEATVSWAESTSASTARPRSVT